MLQQVSQLAVEQVDFLMHGAKVVPVTDRKSHIDLGTFLKPEKKHSG